MTVDVLLERVRELGGTAEANGDRLRLRAPRPLPDELMQELREHKAEVLATLRRPAGRVLHFHPRRGPELIG